MILFLDVGNNGQVIKKEFPGMTELNLDNFHKIIIEHETLPEDEMDSLPKLKHIDFEDDGHKMATYILDESTYIFLLI